MSRTADRATTLAKQHESGRSAGPPDRVGHLECTTAAVQAGFGGLTVGSHPVADAIGSADGENMDFADYLAVVARIVDTVEVPVSVDVESGYGLAAKELIDRLLEAGAVGRQHRGRRPHRGQTSPRPPGARRLHRCSPAARPTPPGCRS